MAPRWGCSKNCSRGHGNKGILSACWNGDKFFLWNGCNGFIWDGCKEIFGIWLTRAVSCNLHRAGQSGSTAIRVLSGSGRRLGCRSIKLAYRTTDIRVDSGCLLWWSVGNGWQKGNRWTGTRIGNWGMGTRGGCWGNMAVRWCADRHMNCMGG